MPAVHKLQYIYILYIFIYPHSTHYLRDILLVAFVVEVIETAGPMSRLSNCCCPVSAHRSWRKRQCLWMAGIEHTPPQTLAHTHTQGSNSIHVYTVFHTCVITPSKDHARAKGSGSEKGISRLAHKGSLQFSTANVIIPFQHVMGLMLMCSGDDDKHSRRKGIMASIAFECFF